MSSGNFRKELLNPMGLITQLWPEADIRHITYDPSLKASQRDYWRIAQSGGDGTMLFTIEMCKQLLLPLVSKSSLKKQAPKKDTTDIKYTIGKIRHAVVYGMVWLMCSETKKYPGLKERVRIPVKCEYVRTKPT